MNAGESWESLLAKEKRLHVDDNKAREREQKRIKWKRNSKELDFVLENLYVYCSLNASAT